MFSRRLTALAILAAFLALAVLSFLGDRILSVVFILVAGAVLAHHATRLCPRCSNRACAFNPRFSRDSASEGGGGEAYSDLKINRTTVIPLLLSGPLAFVAAWRFSPLLTAVVAAVALSAHSVFTHLTCRHCGNDCVGNCNPKYRDEKRARYRSREDKRIDRDVTRSAN